MKRMKSFIFKILLITFSLTLASCMPDSLTKFKEDPPKKATNTDNSGGTVTVIPPDLHPTAGLLCTSGNGSATIEATAANLVPSSSFAGTPFALDAGFLDEPYSEDGTAVNPRHEFVVIGDSTTEITSLINGTTVTTGIICEYADDQVPTGFDNEELGNLITWSVLPALPTGLTQNGSDITGTLTGFNELTAYAITATNSTTGTTYTENVEIASSRPIASTDIFYTQYNGTLYAIQVSDATNFIANHIVLNPNGAQATINFVDYGTNTLYTTISTTAGQEYQRYFKSADALAQIKPGDAAIYANPVPGGTITDIWATLLTNAEIRGAGNDNFALHFTETSGFVDTSVSDGKTPADDELIEWVRCSTSPDISSYGVRFLDGNLATASSSFTDITNVNNWGAPITNTATGDSQYVAGQMDKICEFDGRFSTPINKTTIGVSVFTYGSQLEDPVNPATTSFKVQAKDTIAQPYPITNPIADNDDPEKHYYFHYRYVGSTTDLAKLIITVDNSSQFRYDSTNPDENKISNGRGTQGTITFINGNQLFVTLDANGRSAFVKKDGVDNTATFLSQETVIEDIEYTFELGKDAVLNETVFEPQIALIKGADTVDVSAAGTTITPFGKTEFSEDFLKQVRVGGTISILNETSDTIESPRITAITLTPGSHSLTTAAFGAGITSTVSRTAYLTPLDDSNGEQNTIVYSINNYLGVASVAGTNSDSSDLVLMGSTGAPQIVFKPGDRINPDAASGGAANTTHGQIAITNEITSTLGRQEFLITATDLEGETADADFNFSVSAPPANLTMNRNLLLNVPSGTAFKVGSYISSNNDDPGFGIVKDIISSIETTSPEYYYLDIQVVHGKFEEYDDLDNRSEFDSQKTYVLGDGVIQYNTAVEFATVAESQRFDDKFKCTTNKKYNRFLDGDAAITTYNDVDLTTAHVRGIVAYQWDNFAGDSSTLRPTASNRLYLQLEKGTLSTGDTLRPADCSSSGSFTSLAAGTVTEVLADDIILAHGAAAGTGFIAGLNITSNDGADRGAGVVHSVNGNNTYVGQYYHAANGLFLLDGGGENIDNINPFAATEATITGVTLDHTFYLYRYEAASIEFELGIGKDGSGNLPSDTKIEFLTYDGQGFCSPGNSTCGTGATDCSSHTTRTACENDASFNGQLDDIRWVATEPASPPAGLTFDSTTGRISGTPTINADKEKFIVKVSNPYGSVSHEFELKVYDHFLITPTDTAQDPKPDSYKMHQIGYGMANVPCRVTQEAMDTATAGHANASDVIDLTCVMDGGESDLFYKGLKLTAKTGDDMCTVLNHTPFYYYDWPYIQTDNVTRLYQNEGSFSDPLCGSQPEFVETPTGASFYSSAATPATQAGSGQTTPPADQCLSANGGGDFSDRATPGPNCDDGTVLFSTQTWSAQAFVCTSNGSQTSDTTIADCQNNNGTCTGGTAGTCDASCNADCTACPTNATCTAGASDWTWNSTGSHNDVGAGGADTPAMGCTVEAAVEADVDCGGTQGLCIGGAGSEDQNLSPTDLVNRATLAQVPAVGEVAATYNYAAPFDKGMSSNLFIANYMNRTACNTATYDFNWETAGADNDWLDYAADSPSGASNPFAGGRNLYSYSCDGGSGPVARIRLLVREWDNNFDVTSGLEALTIGAWAGGAGPGNLMDDNDTASTRCAFPSCNNRGDWDDYFSSNTSCGNADLTFDFTNLSGAFQTAYPKEKD
ncbi:MAG: hypothetical protein CME70_08495 [Halobacteriovorax sp.]|nr:hypothetical protein [Halobacteriovorax sp.]|tara:strand:+ start:142123 stop:147264 length:5142 start_codon:yes stop_codon:yes gene_type:complete